MNDYEVDLVLRGDAMRLIYHPTQGSKMDVVPTVTDAVCHIKACDEEHAVELLFQQLNGWIEYRWDGQVEVECIGVVETWTDDYEGITDLIVKMDK